jgi:hypothetical protein
MTAWRIRETYSEDVTGGALGRENPFAVEAWSIENK